MQVYFCPENHRAYVTDGVHLTIHQITDWPSVSSQAEAAHLIALQGPNHAIVATRTQGNRLPNVKPT